MSQRKPFAIYAITRHGISIAGRLKTALGDADVYASPRVRAEAPYETLPMALPMGPCLRDTFVAYDCHIFIISVGAVVRMVAPLMQNKKIDPAIVCVDDAARFSVCVLSGHVGRGNAFTDRVADILGAQSVVTTASDVTGTLTVDILGRELGWQLDDPERNVTAGCAAVVNAAPVLFVQETGEPNFWPLDKPLPPGVRYTTSLDGVDPTRYEMLLVCSDRNLRDAAPAAWGRAVIYRPKSLVLGLGCDRNTPPELVARGVDALLARHNLMRGCVKAVGTISQKADEPALLALCERFGWPLEVFTPAQCDAVPGIENPSETVKRHVGARGVAEPAALLAAGAERLLVPKQVYTEDGAGRSMTLAVARVPFGVRPEVGGSHG
ncbi:MAG TPA: cobalamin biosynthesis protein [Myxococcota bacterium]|nr:cobalamin biosynthesis protein [Myxococcota bacterium]